MIRLFLIGLLFYSSTFADEIRPSFLELTQKSETSYRVLWKKPTRGEARSALRLEVIFPSSAKIQGVKQITQTSSATLETYTIADENALIGKNINIEGLQTISSDVLVRIHYLDGETEFIRVLPQSPIFSLSHKSGFVNMASTYFVLGVEHILEGFDHLLFVLALLLLVGNIRVLIWTISAFTLAHTITLMLASLDLIHLSSRAVEATIALSIIFVAAEIVYAMRGKIHLSKKYPWAIAFGFGLIHGLGFAEALKEIGLPQTEIVPSLIFFNIGVEVGQLLFISFVLLSIWIGKKFFKKYTYNVQLITAYTIGITATVWFLERIVLYKKLISG